MPRCWKRQKWVCTAVTLTNSGWTQQGPYKKNPDTFSVTSSLHEGHEDSTCYSHWTAALTGPVPSISAQFFVKSKSNLQPHPILQSALSVRLLHTSRCCISIPSSQTTSLGLFGCHHSQPLTWLIREETFTLRSHSRLNTLNTPRKHGIISKIVSDLSS